MTLFGKYQTQKCIEEIMSTGRNVKREDSNAIIPDAPGSSSPQQQRATENSHNNNNDDAPRSSTGSSNDGGSINNYHAILKRLGQLKDEKNMPKEKVKCLERCNPTKLVEFKFTSLHTKLLNEHEWNGILHILLIQNLVSGLYKIPNGITTLKGRYTHKKKKKTDNDGGSEVMITEDFLGRIENDSNGNLISFHLGISLEFEVDDDDNERLWLNPSNNFRRKLGDTVVELSTNDKNIVRDVGRRKIVVVRFHFTLLYPLKTKRRYTRSNYTLYYPHMNPIKLRFQQSKMKKKN